MIVSHRDQRPKVHESASVAPNAVLSGNVTIGPECRVLFGAVITAEDIPSLLIDTVHFEENAKAFYDAAQLGKVVPLTTEESNKFHDLFEREKHVVKLWRYYLGRGVASGAVPKEWGEMLAPTVRV